MLSVNVTPFYKVDINVETIFKKLSDIIIIKVKHILFLLISLNYLSCISLLNISPLDNGQELFSGTWIFEG